MPKINVPYYALNEMLEPQRRELLDAVASVVDSTQFCLGREVESFESGFADFLGVKHVIGVNSGTSALHIGMMLLGIGPGDEVVTTPMTFAATCWAISYVGATPVFADIDPVTRNLSPKSVEKAMTAKTRAILPVHLYGQACDLDAFTRLAADNGVALVEDACQAHGGEWRGKKLGAFGAWSAFSFYPGKNLGAFGEGGALATDDDGFAERARRLRNHGMNRQYSHGEIGYNYRMEGVQGAVLRVRLRRLANEVAERRRLAKRYGALLADCPVHLPRELPHASGAWHMYSIRCGERDELMAFLAENGIGSSLHYPVPMHLQPCYLNLGYAEGSMPVAEETGRECLTLPLYPTLGDERQDLVVRAVRRFYKRGRR